MSYICKWCGAILDDDDIEMLNWDNEPAYFCPDCDGVNYLNPADDHRRMILFLEDKGRKQPFASQMDDMCPVEKTGLRKRLSPLRYPGGKSYVIDQIYSVMDKNKMSTFVELFAGGASLGLSLLDAGKIRNLILNDLDYNVANFWNVCVQNGPDLIRMIQATPVDMQLYMDCRAMISNTSDPLVKPEFIDGGLSQPRQSSNVVRAFAFLVVNRLSFGGSQLGGAIVGQNSPPSLLLQRWNVKTLCKRIARVYELRDCIQVKCEKAQSLFSDVVGWLPQDSTIFVDPPYVGVGARLYPLGFKDEHEDLAALLNEFYCCYPGPDIIITYDNCEKVRDLYPYAETILMKDNYCMAPLTKIS